MSEAESTTNAHGRSRLPLATILWICFGVLGAVLALAGARYYLETGSIAADAHAYWLTGQDGYVPYSIAPDQIDAYLYSPVFAQLIWPLTMLPWMLFATVWIGLETAALLWLLRPLGWLPAVVLTIWCSPEVLLGNINALIALAVVLALTRTSAAWAFVALTKPPLAVGALWHVFRRDWHAVAVAAGTTGGVVAVSFALNPSMWRAWMQFLTNGSGDVGARFYVQMAICLTIIAFAALTDRAWLVPIALVLANPLIGGINDFVILAAVPRLLNRQALDRLRFLRHSQPPTHLADPVRDHQAGHRNDGRRG